MKYQNNVLKRVRQIEEKNGINYAKTDGTLYNTLKVIFVIFLAYTLAMNTLFVLGNILLYSSNGNSQIKIDSIITVVTATLFLILNLIIMRFKDYVWSNLATGIINLICPTVLFLTFANLMKDVMGLWGFRDSFYWRHAIPLVFMAVFGVWSAIIALRANLKTGKQYKKVVENIYNQFENENHAQEQWDEYLKNYDI